MISLAWQGNIEDDESKGKHRPKVAEGLL